MAARGRIAITLGVLLVAACSRSQRAVDLKPPFSDDTIVGTLTVRWAETGDRRPAGESGAPEREVAYHVDVANQLHDALYLRINDLHLVGQGGDIATPESRVACTLPAQRTEPVLQGSVWIPETQSSGVRDARVQYLAVPLSERGRAFYREFLLQQRPGDAASIDAELATYADTPACVGSR